MFILDTDLISIIQRQQQPAFGRLDALMGQHATNLFYVTVVSLHEQANGAHAYVNQPRTPADFVRGYAYFERLREYYPDQQVLPFDQPAADLFLQLRPRIQIGAMDLRIAAIVLEHQAVLVTRNARDFGRVPGLTLEDWSQ